MAEKAKRFDPVRAAAVEAIGLVEGGKYNTEESILITSEKKNFSPLDMRFFRQLVNGTVKMKRRLDHDIRYFLSRPSEKLPYRLQNILRLGFFQLFFTDRIPNAAIVSESVDLAHHYLDSARARMVNAVLRNAIRKPGRIVFRNREEDPVIYLADYYSYPEWFAKYCLDEFGYNETVKLLETMNAPPTISFRVNQLMSRPKKVATILKKAEIEFTRGKFLTDYFHLKAGGFPLETELVESGKIYIQDESAGMAVRLLGLEDNMTMLDMAAAPGGKTVYASQIMNNTGMITALDKSRPRLQLLVNNCRRLGVQNVVPVLEDSLEFKGGPFDRVLVDVPCSGWGNAGKHSDLRWTKEKDHTGRLVKLQAMMIDRAARLVKPGGILVYSTCTIIRAENDQIVEEFLLRNKEFKLLSASPHFSSEIVSDRGFLKTYPNIKGLSGAFAAVLMKTGPDFEEGNTKKKKKN